MVLTEEDSGEEDTLSICREIASYVEAQGCDYSIEPNRGEAIRQAVLGCREPSVLLITGKGAETRQKRGTEYIDTPSDVDYVQSFLQEYDVRHGLDGMEKVRSLLSILPILKRDEGRTVVVKYGGSALGAEAATDTTLQDVAALRMVGVRVVLVHGGGKHITALLDKRQVDVYKRQVVAAEDGQLGAAQNGAVTAHGGQSAVDLGKFLPAAPLPPFDLLVDDCLLYTSRCV